MPFYKERVGHLLRLFADNKATEQEIREMLNLLRQDEGDKELESFMMELRQEPDSYASRLPVDWENIWDTIHQSAIQPVAPVRKMKWWRVAAAILILFSASTYFWFNSSTKNDEIVKTESAQELNNDVQPGGSKARLMMADGSVITLDSLQTTQLNEKDGTQIEKNGDKLVYDDAASKGEDSLYNTLTTPRGGKYEVVLSDGSKVWLNAVSSLRFPTKFVGNERKVYLTGEAYFEVAHLSTKGGQVKLPFIVKVNTPSGDGGEVEVLGTHFNINSYADEETINTTLLEGSVKVNGADKSILLSPGEQSQLKPGSSLQVVKGINIDEAVAWKEGFFHFESADLSTILRQFSRWYDIDIVYEGKPKQRKFFGIVSRTSTLMNVLKMLKANDINFRVEGKRLIVKSE